ncbi:MAG TPA: Uma2 family endonuclease [Thermoleophilaceae bacterium]
MGTTTERMTVADYYAITVEGDRKQLVDGRIVVNEPRVTHMRLQTRLLEAFLSWIRAGSGRGEVLPPVDVRLDDHNLFGPDLNWLSETNLPEPGEELLRRIPDICAEIRSPSTWRYDRGAKKDAYERGGLPELWLVDDREPRVLVYRRSRPEEPAFDVSLELREGDTLTSPQLPGFELALGELYRDL